MYPLLVFLAIVYVIGIIAATIFVMAINKQLPERTPRSKRVGPSYWGVYNGAPTREGESLKKIQTQRPGRPIVPLSGSSSYARGG